MSFKKWKEVRLGDICTLNYGKALTAKNRIDGDIPVYSSAGITGRHNAPLVESEGVIIGRKGSVGTVYYSSTPFFCIDTAYYVLPSKEYSLKYLFYRLKSLRLEALNEDSAVPGLNRETAYSQFFLLPPYDEQLEIESILSSLDDKIEQNRMINDNLELQAKAVFKSWFIDFDPFGGIVPPTWEEHTLDECSSLIVKGITPKYSTESTQKIINQKCIRDHRIDLSLTRTHLPKTINDKWLKYGDILINSTGTGTLGRAAQVLFDPENLTVDSHVTIVRPLSAEYIYFLGVWSLNQESTFEKMATGSTGQTDLPRERLKSMSLLIPTIDTMKEFAKTVRPLFSLIIANQQENERLAETRNVLLPMLMSGEIEISQLTL